MRHLSFTLLLPVLVSSLQAAVLHVPDDYATIQDGINAALEGDTVLVADGNYTGDGNRDIDFLGKAIVVMSENGPDHCIIDVRGGFEDHRGFYFHSGEDSRSVLQGFMIENGYYYNGAGIYCYGSSPTITGNTISLNEAYSYGAGIYCYESSPTITGNTISSNVADISGGGIYCKDSSPTIQGNSIVNNTTGDPRFNTGAGGGIYCKGNTSPIIVDNTITGNLSYGNGGGIACEAGASSALIISYNTIAENSAYYEGGGIGFWSSSSPIMNNNLIMGNWTISMYNDLGGGIYCEQSAPEISNNTIIGNSSNKGGGIACVDSSAPDITHNTIADNSGRIGGGIYCDLSNPEISNDVISSNTAEDYGAGIHCDNSSPYIANNTITENSGPPYGGGIYCQKGSNASITNTIFWANDASWAGPEIALYDSSTLTINYTDVSGGRDLVYVDGGSVLNWGIGMIDADPLFISFHGFDYLLRRRSPCIDAGDPSLEDGFDWPPEYSNSPRSDMGAYGGPGNIGWLP